MRSLSDPSPKPSGGFELWSWLFMRVSGLALVFLALGHLVLMHLIHNVDAIDYNFVAARYVGWGWRSYDLAMLLLAMLHGFNGARILVDDYLHRPVVHGAALWLLRIVTIVFLVLGTYVILFFQPVSGPQP